MTLVPVMWVVWGVLAVAAAALYLYRSNLTRDEEDQIYLDDAFQHEKIAQEAIVAKVGKVEPVLRVAVWLVAGWTLLVAAYYVWDIIAQFK
jgi:type VI protein secretion system component VasF